MKLVIEIPYDLYISIIKDYSLTSLGEVELYKAVQGGRSIPEHCGRCIDADELRKTYHNKSFDSATNDVVFNTMMWVIKQLDKAPTIVGANTQGE